MKSLSDAAVRQYHELGYYAPVPVLTRISEPTTPVLLTFRAETIVLCPLFSAFVR